MIKSGREREQTDQSVVIIRILGKKVRAAYYLRVAYYLKIDRRLEKY